MTTVVSSDNAGIYPPGYKNWSLVLQNQHLLGHVWGGYKMLGWLMGQIVAFVDHQRTAKQLWSSQYFCVGYGEVHAENIVKDNPCLWRLTPFSPCFFSFLAGRFPRTHGFLRVCWWRAWKSMVKHQPLQYYEPQLCLSCLTGIYGCRWKRYQRSHDDTTKVSRSDGLAATHLKSLEQVKRCTHCFLKRN